MLNASIENNFYFPIINLNKKVFKELKLKEKEHKRIIKLQQSFTNLKCTKFISDSKKNLISQTKIIKSKFENKETNSKNKYKLSKSLINFNDFNKINEENQKHIKNLKEIFANEFIMKKKLSIIKEYQNKKNPIGTKIIIKNERKLILNKIPIKINNLNSRNKSVILKNIPIDFNIDNFTNKIREKKELELKLEKKDKYNDLSINDLKLLSKTKNYFSNFNLYFRTFSNYTKNFYKIKENKINFIEDCNKIPFLQNKFVKLELTNFFYFKVSNNIIKPNILTYLNKLRYQIEKDKELSKKNEEENNKIKDFESRIDKIIFDNKDLLSYSEEYKNNYKNKIKLENKVENYLNLKYSKFQNVKISNEKNRKSIFQIFKTIN